MKIIIWIIALSLIFAIVLLVIIMKSIKKQKKREVIEHYLTQGWNAIAQKNTKNAREYYQSIREVYSSKNDPKKKLLKRINLFFSKVSEMK